MGSYVYVHFKPDWTPFYVGKGCKKRAHNFVNRSARHKRVLAKYGKANIHIKLWDFKTDEAAFAAEVFLIKLMRQSGIRLVNMTDGGEGMCNPTEETRRKKSEAMRGRKYTEEHKRRISEALKGRIHPPQVHEAVSRAKKGAKEPKEKTLLRAAKLEQGHYEKGMTKPVIVDGVYYTSINKAARSHGVGVNAIRYALAHSGMFNGHKVERA